MKVLIVKMSSMGDIIHSLPAITDAVKHFPNIEFHWVVEENFQEIPAWLPSVTKVIPIALRRWRKQGLYRSRKEIQAFIQELRQTAYDLVIDMQGLVKSALITRLAKGKKIGLDFRSARESLAACFYDKHIKVVFEQHAILRARLLLSQALAYPLPQTTAQTELALPAVTLPVLPQGPVVIFFHATTWATKHWAEEAWQQLALALQQQNIQVLLPWSSAVEQESAQRIAAGNQALVLPKLSLTQMAALLSQVSACVAVDTGLGHLAAVLGIPAISLYGATNPVFTGTLGISQAHLTGTYPCAPCLAVKCQIKTLAPNEAPPCMLQITPEIVLAAVLNQLQVRA